MSYRGYDVLEGASHNMRDAIAQSFGRLGAFAGSPVGRREWQDYGGSPFPTRPFSWTAVTRAEVAALLAFVEARRGRTVPFWVPSYGSDLTLAADAHAGDAALVVQNVGYTTNLWPFTCRRYLALMQPGGAFQPVKVTSAVAGDETETLGLFETLTVDCPRATALVCFLLLCRLDQPSVRIHFELPTVAETTMVWRELPREVPA